ncbi:hypothetical protein [Paenibacillus sp. GCM10012303]|jgi:hypothetical protein|uniref:hypothetical protein n=1 Tax=Paenibacillus sp. GCM10012303 TaxID=3317340 RepID=UPI00361772FC
MNWIAIQPYYKIERRVTSFEQVTVKEDRFMYLFEKKIVTETHDFPIKNVFDLSYKRIGKEGGLFYLHTLQGVYSYTVAGDPQSFIDAFKALVHSSKVL